MSRPSIIMIAIVTMLAALWQAGTSYAAPAPQEPTFDDGVAAYDAGDFPRAYQIWQALAAENDPAAMRNLGHMLRRGLGTPRDLKAAFRHYKRAAEMGLPAAQLNLAEAYQKGMGTNINLTEARHWTHEAAKAGHPLAQFFYGKMLADGTGGPIKNEDALIFLNAALKAGVKGAAPVMDQVLIALHPKLNEGADDE